MPSESYQLMKVAKNGTLYVTQSLQRGWQHSPRSPSGELLLQNLGYTKELREVYFYSDDTGMVPTGPTGMAAGYANAVTRANNQAYSRFRGKLYKGSAALGVSLASYKQSREMIVARADQINRGATRAYEAAMRSKRTHVEVAGSILEALFGWKPLLADIHSALHTVIQSAAHMSKYSGTGLAYISETKRVSNPSYVTTLSKRGSVKVRYVTNVVVRNPNTWLAERAGLYNPLAVAWDLVPWSFVVNMFVNTGSLVNSVTDFAGLEITYQTTTQVDQNSETRTAVLKSPGSPSGKMSGFEIAQSRAVGVPLQPPTLEFRVPEANWELAAIAGSLMVQKVTRLANLYRKLTNSPLSYTE